MQPHDCASWLKCPSYTAPVEPARSRQSVLKGPFELELMQSHVAQKPVLRGEVGCACVAREVSVERGGMGERKCARRLGGWVWVCYVD